MSNIPTLRWTSVKDALPPMDEEVIVLTDDVHGKNVPGANRRQDVRQGLRWVEHPGRPPLDALPVSPG